MTFVVFLCAWVDNYCAPYRMVGAGFDAHAHCLEYTYKSEFQDGCFTIAVKGESL